MAIEAPVSRNRKTNLKIYIIFCLALAAWCLYDGYINQSWIQKHTDEQGNPEPFLVFNQYAPFVLGGLAGVFGLHLYAIRGRKLIADENGLVFSGNDKISYDSIEKIDKTYFKSKGYFIITYKDDSGREIKRKISDRNYDNLSAVLDQLVAKIS